MVAMKIACVFPGQGSQKVGMCKDLKENFALAKQVFDEVDDALDQKLSHIIFEGPQETLSLTENAQPALLACSIALLKVLEQELGQDIKNFASYLAGHSLGEFTALAAGGAISLSDAAKVLKVRGKSMQNASPSGMGAMFALLGANIDIANELALNATTITKEPCQIANYNSAEQQVLSGSTKAIDYCIQTALQKGYKAIKLDVSAPFHSILIKDAQEPLRQMLESIQISQPQIPIIANITADILDNAQIIDNLTKQVVSTVRWYESVQKLVSLGVTTIIEIGPGKTLTNLNKRIDSNIRAVNIADVETLKQAVQDQIVV